MCDLNHKHIIELINKNGNSICADCGDQGVEYSSYNLGVFLCTTCATIHQKIGTHVSKVKSLKLAKWNDDQAQAMESLGNTVAKKKYEKHVPLFYRRPVPDDPSILTEQWIRAKYERLEFIHVDKQKYNKGSMEGTLLVKKRRDDSAYSPKLFILNEENSTLSIYSKDDSKEAKVSIPLARLNISLAPKKINMDYSMQLTFIEDGATRHIFAALERGDDNGKIVIDWYMSIRHAKLIALMRAYPTAKQTELISYLTKDFLMEGWVSKTGPSENDAYRKRWVTLDRRKLMYHVNPMDEIPRGEIFLGHRSEGFDIREGASVGTKEMGFGFSLVTPERTFVFSVASTGERQKWMTLIDQVVSAPLGPQDIQCRVLMDPAKKRASRHSWFHF